MWRRGFGTTSETIPAKMVRGALVFINRLSPSYVLYMRVVIFAAVTVLSLCGASAQTLPGDRILSLSYLNGSQGGFITLIDVAPNGPVTIGSSLDLSAPRHRISHGEFDRMWNTLLANGVKTLDTKGPAKIQPPNTYSFSLAEVPSAGGHKLIVPKVLLVAVDKAPPAVAAVARQIRGLF